MTAIGKHWVSAHESHRHGKRYRVEGHYAEDPKLTAHDRAVDRRNIKKAERARERE